MTHDDWRVRHHAVIVVGDVIDDPRAIPLLVVALQDSDTWVAMCAVHALADVAQRCDRADDAYLPLLRSLDDPRLDVRWSAATELVKASYRSRPGVATRLDRFHARHGTQQPPLTVRHTRADGQIVQEVELDA